MEKYGQYRDKGMVLEDLLCGLITDDQYANRSLCRLWHCAFLPSLKWRRQCSMAIPMARGM
jgi:hypothetical protein